MNQLHSQALIASLRDAPLLVADLPEATSFDRRLFDHPDPLVILNENQKLGHLYEDALCHLMRASQRFELVADHVQVFDADGITLGEMDMILQDRQRRRFLQLELAVKFYLAVRTADGWEFPGPDPKDNWLRKLQHLRERQFALAARPEARDLLQARWGIRQIEVQQLIYGCIFTPINLDGCVVLPDGLRADCRKGHWLYAKDWERFLGNVREVHLVPKYLWPVELIAPLRASLPRVGVAELRSAVKQRCVMFARPDAPQPYFLVPDRWPAALS
jgi:hypothetical protein